MRGPSPPVRRRHQSVVAISSAAVAAIVLLVVASVFLAAVAAARRRGSRCRGSPPRPPSPRPPLPWPPFLRPDVVDSGPLVMDLPVAGPPAAYRRRRRSSPSAARRCRCLLLPAAARCRPFAAADLQQQQQSSSRHRPSGHLRRVSRPSSSGRRPPPLSVRRPSSTHLPCPGAQPDLLHLADVLDSSCCPASSALCCFTSLSCSLHHQQASTWTFLPFQLAWPSLQISLHLYFGLLLSIICFCVLLAAASYKSIHSPILLVACLSACIHHQILSCCCHIATIAVVFIQVSVDPSPHTFIQFVKAMHVHNFIVSQPISSFYFMVS